jgi:hypothetical protein
MSFIKKPSRRQILRGAGGFALALPFLRSLEPKPAFAGEAPFAAHPRFIAMSTPHGAVSEHNMFPATDMLTDSQEVFPGHTMRRGTLQPMQSGNNTVLSPVLTAPSSLMSQSLVSRMNILKGLDIMFYIGHHGGGFLGNYADTDNTEVPLTAIPTIDQLMAWSPTFYPDIDVIRERSLTIGSGRGISWGYSNPLHPEQNNYQIQQVPSSESALALFNSVFVPDEGPAPRPPVVDRVLESYKRLASGAFGDATRLSNSDRQRLNDHMDRLSELERKLKVTHKSCGFLPAPSKDVDQNHPGVAWETKDVPAMIEYHQIYNDVIVAAMICGTSRIATIQCWQPWYGEILDWHHEVAHEHLSPGPQQKLVEANRTFFQNVFLDLANKLNEEEADGVTYLDNTLMTWAQESGAITHDPYTIPVVTAGSAAGFLTTGNYIDYRNMNNMGLQEPWFTGEQAEMRPGLCWNQWLATVLRSMGISPSEFEKGAPGYGDTYIQEDRAAAWPSYVLSNASEVLPFLKA